jgi:DNA-binding PadR family transcriptional regulator
VTKGQLADLGRLEEPSLLVLVSLSSGPKHGYAIQTDVAAFARVQLGPGTLYAILPRLERLGLIQALESDDRRRPYRLTGEGAARLRAELDRQGAIARLGLDRLGAGR